MTETNASVTWLTQEAYDRLQGELAYLSGEGRAEIAKKIESAREEGDLKENGGYHAAKEEQGKQEARIRQLRQLLESAHVGDAPTSVTAAGIQPGMVVSVNLAGEELDFLLGSREVAGDDTDLEVYSEKSPLGSAILGRKIGDSTTFSAPNGKSIAVKILDAKPYAG